MIRLIAALFIATGLALGATALAADTQPATSTKPATPACCGDTCKKMGNCCKLDASGKVSCPMSGKCCSK